MTLPDGCICVVRGAPDGPTDLGCGGSDSSGHFCIDVPPLQSGWIIYVVDTCPPSGGTLQGQPQLIGPTPAPTLGVVGLIIGFALLSLVGLVGVRRLRWWPKT
jgi:hypothetical protein